MRVVATGAGRALAPAMENEIQITVVAPFSSNREIALAAAAARHAVETGRVAIHVRHGGGVAYAYAYPAETEGVVVVAFPDGRAAVWCGRLPANKVTGSGVVATCVGGQYRAIADNRFGDAAARAARASLIALAERELAARAAVPA